MEYCVNVKNIINIKELFFFYHHFSLNKVFTFTFTFLILKLFFKCQEKRESADFLMICDLWQIAEIFMK